MNPLQIHHLRQIHPLMSSQLGFSFWSGKKGQRLRLTSRQRQELVDAMDHLSAFVVPSFLQRPGQNPHDRSGPG